MDSQPETITQPRRLRLIALGVALALITGCVVLASFVALRNRPPNPREVTYRVSSAPANVHIVYRAANNPPANAEADSGGDWETTFYDAFERGDILYLQAFQLPSFGSEQSEIVCQIIVNGRVWQEAAGVGECAVRGN